MQYRALREGDIPALLALQEANLFDNLDESQRQRGFLSARFTAGHLDVMAREVAVMVAEHDGVVAGYLCASRPAFNEQFRVLAAMLAGLPALSFLGRPLRTQRCFVYGPACVALGWRGKGVLRGLYDSLRERLAGEYDFGVLFIAKGNAASLSAHADGLGMAIVGEFECDGRGYWTLAFPVRRPPHC
jgi:hypothetical protein